MPASRLAIARHWDGTPLPAAHHAFVEVSREDGFLVVGVDAPYFGDPPPSAAPGPVDRLWEHEVVELFLADAGEHYFELELGPHGHHLALELHGVRRVVRSCLPLDYGCTITPHEPGAPGDPIGRFRGRARVPLTHLPPVVRRANAYAIHGSAGERCHHAHAPARGAQPDFHRLESFVPFELGGG